MSNWKRFISNDAPPARNERTGRPLFAGWEIDARMAEIRRSIVKIRNEWTSTYSQYAESLIRKTHQGIKLHHNTEERRTFESRMNALLHQRDWCDRTSSSQPNRQGYEILRLYTSNLGQALIFGDIKGIFRDEQVSSQEIELATFVIELLNIDLFNYVTSNPSASDFEGSVYRGMVVTPEEMTEFENLARSPAGKSRAFSVPLGIDSTSINPETACNFITMGLSEKSGRIPLIHKIHVHNLPRKLLDLYTSHYSSVVTTIGAVPLHDETDYQAENEVILRGPFYQLIRYLPKSEHVIGGKGVPLVESVMLNANRDHHSTLAVEHTDPDGARKIFGALIDIRRSEICRERSESEEDAAIYAKEHDAARRALDAALGAR